MVNVLETKGFSEIVFIKRIGIGNYFTAKQNEITYDAFTSLDNEILIIAVPVRQRSNSESYFDRISALMKKAGNYSRNQ